MSTTFLAPVDALPPEGADVELSSASAVDFCTSLLANSESIFHVSSKGALLQANPQESDIFQSFEVSLSDEATEPQVSWQDSALSIQLQGLVPDQSAFNTLSDASDPDDCVRRFLEVLRSTVKNSGIGGEDGTALPMVRWQAGEDEASAEVQLLGFLLASDEELKYFNDETLIFEDSEVQAHGAREMVTALLILGVTLGSVTDAEAGLFKKLKQKRQAAKAQLVVQQQMVAPAPAPVVQQQSGWRDVHNDAYINYNLLEMRKDGEKKVIVDIARQRAFLLIDNMIAIDTAVSTARAGKETPRGVFKITQRVEHGKTSTIYGCDLPYWQRLDGSAIGLHVGDLPGYPASAGCIRLPYSVAPTLFANTASGVEVEVVDLWDQQELYQGTQAVDMVASNVNYYHSSQQAN